MRPAEVVLSSNGSTRSGSDVNYNELVKGYEIAKEQYVRLSQEDLDQLEASEYDAMQILEFVPLSAVDPIYYENTYYLVSEKQGEKAYLLLAQAMETMERVALAKFVWRGKESLDVIRSVQGKLLLHRTTRMKFGSWKRGPGVMRTRASGAGDQRLHQVDDSALCGDTVHDAWCRAVTADAEQAGPTYPQVTVPLAVVIQDQYGKRHCQEIQP